MECFLQYTSKVVSYRTTSASCSSSTHSTLESACKHAAGVLTVCNPKYRQNSQIALFRVAQRSFRFLLSTYHPMATHAITSPVILDSLPYYDNDLSANTELQALVDAEIAKELKSMPPLDPSRLPPELQLFKVSLVVQSFYNPTQKKGPNYQGPQLPLRLRGEASAPCLSEGS